ncbi:MAG: RNA 2',3'-cyclic phosphodiesterase [Deltaproteobacteria bacterium]|nr:RNA 2',3'-cyclic phosphodiesterase [Deltaproteobacteria bacterium]
MRAFIAVRPPEELRVRLAEAAAGRVRPPGTGRMGVEGARFVPAENLHLTLKFLGDVDPAKQPAVEASLLGVARGQRPFRVTLDGAGGFPDVRRPRILWVGTAEGAGELAALAAQVQAAMAPLGWAREEKGFRAHITLGRVRRPRPGTDAARWAAALAAQEFGSFEVTELVLFESVLRPEGPRYQPLRRFPLTVEGLHPDPAPQKNRP